MRERIQRIVDGYKSIRLEGQDQGFVVYAGKESDTKQVISIKILPQSLEMSPQLARKFEGLARTIRQLNHPNIAPIRKVGEEEGLPYVITRTLEKAQPLAAKLDQPWAVDMAADVAMQVGQALEHAYNKGIVHGSLTPENIAVEDNGRVTVTDFGLTELQDLVGVRVRDVASPFLAPERVAGGSANAQGDIYSMAAVLYGMLANRPPEVVDGQVVPPSHFNEDVSPKMDAVVVKALDPDPAERYPDVRTFLTALGTVPLVPAAGRAQTATDSGRCPYCGAKKQTERFCRKCGTRLEHEQEQPVSTAPRSPLDEPILVTKVDVGRVKVGKGVELQDTVIAQPMSVATGDVLDLFPEPIEVPRIDLQQLRSALGGEHQIRMPQPPPMPNVDWDEIAPPMPEVPTFEDTLVSTEDD